MLETDNALIQEACAALSRGRLVAFPTETVYGLGADATNLEALELLYKVKGRPQSHPSIVHLASLEQVGDWCCDVPEAAEVLGNMFWPGPLTLVLKKAAHVPLALTGGQDTIAVRVPSHPLALTLLQEFKRGVAAPSANRFGKISATCAADVGAEFGSQIDLILDGGPCQVGIESTIVDFTCGQPRILRPGMIIQESINVAIAELGLSVTDIDDHLQTPRVPGSMASHYAPAKPLELIDQASLSLRLKELAAAKIKAGVLAFSKLETPSDEWIVGSNSAAAYAYTLYRNLRKLDQSVVSVIVVEQPPQEPEWQGITDRLRRAAGKRGGQAEPADGS